MRPAHEPNCRHDVTTSVARCLGCAREERELQSVIRARAAGCTTARELEAALKGIRLPHGYSVSLVATTDGLQVRLTRIRPATTEGGFQL